MGIPLGVKLVDVSFRDCAARAWRHALGSYGWLRLLLQVRRQRQIGFIADVSAADFCRLFLQLVEGTRILLWFRRRRFGAAGRCPKYAAAEETDGSRMG